MIKGNEEMDRENKNSSVFNAIRHISILDMCAPQSAENCLLSMNSK
jgi:hypothetical protein